MVNKHIEKGQLLIAKPSIIGDVSFNRSVILMAEHNGEGSIGFILNKPLDYTLNELVPDIDASFKIFNGGPVEQDNLYFIHKIPEQIPNSIEISQGIFWGGDFKVVSSLINQNQLSNSDIKFFLGYTGWAVNQLNDELESDTWIILENIYKSNIIEKNDLDFWKEKMLELGGEYSIWSNAPENPSYN